MLEIEKYVSCCHFALNTSLNLWLDALDAHGSELSNALNERLLFAVSAKCEAKTGRVVFKLLEPAPQGHGGRLGVFSQPPKHLSKQASQCKTLT